MPNLKMGIFEIFFFMFIQMLWGVQGVRGQSGFFNWALTERNIHVRLYLKVVLKSWDMEILIFRTNFQKKYHRLASTASNRKGAKIDKWYFMISQKIMFFRTSK